MASRRPIRYEEYAASGVVEVTEVANQLSHIKIRPDKTPSASSASSIRCKHAASSSHHENEHYLQEFDAAYEELQRLRAIKKSNASASKPETKESSHSKQSIGRLDAEPVESTTILNRSWLRGPSSPEGTQYPVSAQPLLCMSMSHDAREVVVGSSDHALYVIPLTSSTGPSASRARTTTAKPKTLYTKKYGHTEWVTCVTYLQTDRRIVSGGMDSKLCLWDETGVRCEDLVGHAGSISVVKCLPNDLVLSASYDKTIRVWNVSKKARDREVSSIKATSAPILDVGVLQDVVVTGDRDGAVHAVDLEQGKVSRKHTGAHTGHTTSVLGSRHDGSNCYFSGGQDGILNVWDLRQKVPVETLELHVGRDGKRGAVGFLNEPVADTNVLITAGADGTIKVLDKRKSFDVMHNFTEHMDFIYSLHVAGQLCFSGAGNGMLHVHDWQSGKLLYGLGANKAAVRSIATTTDQLIAAGDDGGVLVYDMH